MILDIPTNLKSLKFKLKLQPLSNNNKKKNLKFILIASKMLKNKKISIGLRKILT